ncbi:YebC/PmpR family DNA-binding transcriptional regulator, partial [Ruminococcus difficilis]|nr:YebC/PmpR family DNA-binding transcriptional regulator [Ruminococcus difficilis]
VPDTYTKLEDEDSNTKFQKMLDMFDDNDDIQNVWHNLEY